MLSLTFYKGVPFDREQQNVLFVDNEKRNEFLSNYIVPIQTLEIKQFALLGTTNNPFLVVSLDKEPFNVNYLKVIQTIEKTGEERMLFYYIDNYEMVTPENVRLNLTMDFFQTYFNKYNMQENKMERPEIKNALVMQGHGFENGGETEEMIQPDKVIEYYQAEQILSSTAFKIVFHITTSADNGIVSEMCLVSHNSYISLEDTLKILNKYMLTPKGVLQYDNGEQEIQNIKVLNAYLIPVDFLPHQSVLITHANFYFDTTQSATDDFYYISSYLDDLSGASFSRVIPYEITPRQAEQTSVGTASTRIETKFNGKTYNVTIRIVIANDIQISMYCNNESKDITNDFEVNVVYDEYANYMNQTKNTRYWNTTTKVLAGAGGMLQGAGQLMTGNPMGLGTMIGSAVGMTTAVAKEQAIYNDMDSKPANLVNDTGSLISIRYFQGFCVLRLRPANYDDIITYDNYFGFKMNGFNSTLNIFAQNENQKFRYCQCSYLSLIGNFDYEIKERLESYFKRGIRIWYDKDNYLNGFEP